MKRKFLEAMGFTGDQVDSIMEEHGKTVNQVRTQRDTFEDEAEALRLKVKELEKASGSSETTQQELETLKREKADLQAKLDSTQLDSLIKLSVAKDAKDANDILFFLDKSTLKFAEDGKTIEGLDEAVKTLKESKPYLFETDGSATPGDTTPPPGTTPPGATTPPPPNYTPPTGNTNNPKDTDLIELGRKDAERYAPKQ